MLVPTQAFAMLTDASARDRSLAAPECVLGPLLRDLEVAFPDFLGIELEAALISMALLAWSNIAPIEARHGTARRIIYSRTQTHAISLPELASHFVCMQTRRMRLGVKTCFKTGGETDNDHEDIRPQEDE